MNPVCFHIGPKPIYWYGVMTAVGFLAAVIHWNWLAHKEKKPAGYGSDLGFWVMFSGIIGARLAYILANPREYVEHPLAIFRIDQGGLIFYGGFIAAALAVIVFARLKKEPLWAVADFAVTGLPLGHAFGRIGCFLNGCCFGRPSECFLAVHYPPDTAPWAAYGGQAVFPVQLLEAFFNLLVYVMLAWFFPRRKNDGAVFAWYLLVYPVFRFAVEFFRGDERQPWLGLDVAQIVSVGLWLCGVALWWWIARRRAAQS